MDLKKLNWVVEEPILQKKMEDCWINDDPIGCLVAISNMEYLRFLFEHMEPLKEKGFYEEVLLTALIAPSINLSGVPLYFLKSFLEWADKEKLRGYGDPLPGNGPFTLYRGVAGKGAARRKRGISWTASLEKAKWFANRFYLEKPMVYESVIDLDQVYAYSNGRNEQEFICLIPDNHKLKKVWG
jgi:hypothetical protein